MVIYTLIAMVAGVLVGSFLNVVIHRLPLIIRRDHEAWINEHAPNTFQLGEPVNLALPASACPHCGHEIKWYQNIPVLSWLWLMGVSACCKKSISMIYPVTELLGGLIALFAIQHYGVSIESLLIFTAGCLLLTLSVIDFKHYILPDGLVVGLLIAGLVYQIQVLKGVQLESVIISMMIVFAVLEFVRLLGRAVFKKEVLGFGDVKLLVAMAGWVGGLGVLWIVFLASLLVILAYISCSLKKDVYPFGPSLCASLIVVFFNSEALNQYLLGF